MKKIVTSLLLVSVTLLFVNAQVNPGEITGRIVDSETGEPLMGASVYLPESTLGTATDLNGYYTIKPLDPGTYNVEVSYIGYQKIGYNNVEISDGQVKVIDVAMDVKVMDVVIEIRPVPDGLYSNDGRNPTSIDRVQMNKIPTDDLQGIVSIMAQGVYQQDEDEPILFRGSRPQGTLYFVDGVKSRIEPGIPANGIGHVSVYSGGIPAKYGDATGGIVVITTRSYFDRR